MMTKKIFSLAVVACFAIASVANAGVTAIVSEQVDNSGGGAPVAGTVTNDIKIDFTGQYSGSQLLLQLASGGVYRDAFGNANGAPPNSAFFGAFPSLEFDSFVAQGSVGSPGAFGEPLPGGGAVDLGGAAAALWPANGGDAINQAWNPAGGQVISDQAGFLIARLTLTPDANGTVIVLASAGGEITEIAGTVQNGVVNLIPEPATLALFGLGMIGVLSSRRRS